MTDAGARVIDLESYRRVRVARGRTTEPSTTASNAPAAPLAWIPVWVMPVFFIVASPAAVAGASTSG